MLKRALVVPLAGLALLAACSGESPTAASPAVVASGEMVITQGAPAPAPATHHALRSNGTAATDLGGSVSTPLGLTPQSCPATASQQVVITYTVSGQQDHSASFQVNTHWEYDGSNWSGSAPTTVNVTSRSASTPMDTYKVTATVMNASATASGTSSIVIAPFGLVTTTTDVPGKQLNLGAGSHATIFVAFGPCAVANTAPTLVLPEDMTVEATSSAGAVVNFTVTASDHEDGDLSSSVVCTPASGSTFALGTTTVNCSVTDLGGLTMPGSFKVTVVDTTPAFFTSFPTGTVQLVAADINGAVLDLSSLNITVEDVGHVSEPSTFSCDYTAGTVLGIGTTTTVSCTAKDHIGNESAPSTFDVFVGLNVSAQGFLQPLRMVAPFSAHKMGSTIPHKFLPPTYADGTPAIDLAPDLRLVLDKFVGAVPGTTDVEVNDFSAGSTAWRYDTDAGQYIFNLKTGTALPWEAATWQTTVSYKGITLATTQFDLRR
jgi:hypothetical protein